MARTTVQPVVVVTGASAGVGRAIARAFAKEGAKLGLIARGEKGLEAARKDVEALGGEAVAVRCDVADAEQVAFAASRIKERFGPVDIWVNNAMVSVFSPVKRMEPAEYKRVTEVTYLGYVYGTLQALEQMLPRDAGTIIQVGSALAYRGIPLQSAYCAAKHAIGGFTESLRTELIHDGSGVNVCVIQLPAVNTPQFSWVKSRLPHKAQPVPPIFQPEVIADAVVWLSRHPRREIYVGLATTAAIVADKLAPGLLDHYLARMGYESQQTDEPADPSRPHNLWQPVEGDHGARGAFSARARDFSVQFWLSRHKAGIAAVGAAFALCAAARHLLLQPPKEAS